MQYHNIILDERRRQQDYLEKAYLKQNINTINKQISNLNSVNKRIKALCSISITLNIGLISYLYNKF
jgi:hypothetical protein